MVRTYEQTVTFEVDDLDWNLLLDLERWIDERTDLDGSKVSVEFSDGKLESDDLTSARISCEQEKSTPRSVSKSWRKGWDSDDVYLSYWDVFRPDLSVRFSGRDEAWVLGMAAALERAKERKTLELRRRDEDESAPPLDDNHRSVETSGALPASRDAIDVGRVSLRELLLNPYAYTTYGVVLSVVLYLLFLS